MSLIKKLNIKNIRAFFLKIINELIDRIDNQHKKLFYTL